MDHMCMYLSRSGHHCAHSQRALCSDVLGRSMPRCSGARTGQKQKRARKARAKENASVQDVEQLDEEPALEVAATSEPATPAWLDDDFQEQRAVADVVEQMVEQLEDEESRKRRARVWHDSHVAAAVACAEACKRRALGARTEEEQHALWEGAFREAHSLALREWKAAYPEERCHACRSHLAYCMCLTLCSKCGTRIPARAWRLNVGGLPNVHLCSCEKISNLLSLVF